MNKKGIIPVVLIMILAILLFIFFTSLTVGFKIADIIKNVPPLVWYIIIIIILWRLFSKSK